jgi:polyribonucleotide nucleotidyltransferase
MEIITKEFEISGRKITIETGKMALQADGAAVVSCEGTSVLATAVASADVRPIDFVPLTVDVEEKLYAAGKIPGSFFRREGRPTEAAMLTARIVDRTIRPSFDKKFRNEAQVVITVLSTDQVNPPDMLGLIGATAALQLSDIPFNGPLAGVRVGHADGEWLINPTYPELEGSTLNLIVAGNKDGIQMVEAGAKEVPESEMLEALDKGHEAIKMIIDVILELDADVRRVQERKPKDDIMAEIKGYLEPKYVEACKALIDAYDSGDSAAIEANNEKIKVIPGEAGKHFPNEYRKVVGILARVLHGSTLADMLAGKIEPDCVEPMSKALLDASVPGLTKADRSIIRKDTRRSLAEQFVAKYFGLESYVKDALDALERKLLRRQILDNNLRPDGRKPFQIRKLTCEVGLLSKTHGSALFTRGETQVLTIATLGAYGEKQILDDLGTEEFKSFLHHYNFPPFSVGEARPMRGPKRREIGHGALAERALLPLIPNEEEFPYTIRLVSEVLASNGSSSMGSVCASSMSLMDAGVPLKDASPVSGIAMGLVLEGDSYVILSDIQGLEDSTGDMDFKVAGSRNGITALQMDIKCSGLSTEILSAALEQARQGRSFIMKAMTEAIGEPRDEVSPNAPRMVQIQIPVDKIGELIGPGGRNIRGLIERYEVDIDVENDGRVFIFGRESEKVKKVQADIAAMMRVPEVGDRYLGTVVKTTNFGAFVELTPGKDGLIHISKLSDRRVERVEDVVNIGDKVEVEIEAIDNLGRINLRAIDLKPESD